MANLAVSQLTALYVMDGLRTAIASMESALRAESQLLAAKDRPLGKNAREYFERQSEDLLAALGEARVLLGEICGSYFSKLKASGHDTGIAGSGRGAAGAGGRGDGGA